MAFTVDTPLSGSPRGSADAFFTWAVNNGCRRQDDVRAYLDTVYTLAPQLDLNPDIVVVQSIHETSENGAPWASHWWQQRCNPAGIGITGDPNDNEASRDFANGVAAARAHLLHLHLYANGANVPDGFDKSEDPRWDAAIAAGFAGIANILKDLTGRWGVDPLYGDKIAGHLTDFERDKIIGQDLAQPDRGPLLTSSKPYVLLVAGHRAVGDTGGTEAERRLTQPLALAYLETFRAAGFETDWIQQIDGDDLPDMTTGGLHGLATKTARHIGTRSDKLILMLDLHFNGPSSSVHVIVPHNLRKDGRGPLGTDYVQGRIAEDIAENNPLDVNMAAAIAREIVTIPGMRMWGPGKLGVPGVMLENESGVGNDDGEPPDNARLAMMATTAPFRMNTVRITIEHGGTNDADRPDFFNQCAQASLRAITQVLADRIRTEEVDLTPEEDAVVEEAHKLDHQSEGAAIPSLAEFLFGAVGVYAFNPDGAVSRLWLKTGNESGRFPRLVDVLNDGDSRYYAFSDGSVIVMLGENVEYLDRLP